MSHNKREMYGLNVGQYLLVFSKWIQSLGTRTVVWGLSHVAGRYSDNFAGKTQTPHENLKIT